MGEVFKAGRQHGESPMQFRLSDSSVDGAGDVIRSSAWRLERFKANPIALFGHDHDQVIGTWEDVRVEGKSLLGRLKLAKPGTSPLIDTVRSLLEQGVLKAVSVGFQPLAANPRKGGGYEYTEAELHEVSLVAVPCNANALAMKMVKATNPDLADRLFVRPDTEAQMIKDGRLTHTMQTPKLDAARAKLKALGIDY